jgi:hypothetical protein
MPLQQGARRARAHLASAEAALRRNPHDPKLRAQVDERRRAYRTEALAEHIQGVVDAAPPLSQAQRDRLALLLRPAPTDTEGAA